MKKIIKIDHPYEKYAGLRYFRSSKTMKYYVWYQAGPFTICSSREGCSSIEEAEDKLQQTLKELKVK